MYLRCVIQIQIISLSDLVVCPSVTLLHRCLSDDVYALARQILSPACTRNEFHVPGRITFLSCKWNVSYLTSCLDLSFALLTWP